MTEYLMPILRGAGFSILYPAALIPALWAIGGAFFRINRSDDGRDNAFLSFTAGLDLAALFVLVAMTLFPGVRTPGILAVLLLCAGVICGFFARRPGLSALFRRKNLVFLLPASILLAYLGFTFTYPGGWDECVYQFAVPRRWAESGSLSVLDDIPYSGFPALPQIFYVPLYAAGGVMGIRLFTFFVQCILIAGTIPLFRGRRTEGAFLLAAFLLAPVVVTGFCHSYAELFLSLNLLAGIRMGLTEKGNRRGFILSGLFAGAMAAVKLSGILPAVCLLLWRLLRMPRGSRIRRALVFLSAGAFFAGMFYARPLAETGNPCYPYLAGLFGSEHKALSEYHHRLGRDKFGYDNALTGFPRSFSDLSRPDSSNPFDGTFGIPFLLWLAASAALLLRLLRHPRSRKWIPPLFFPPLLFYAGWYLSSPQARFLIPGAILAIPVALFFLRTIPRPCRFGFLSLLLICALVSVPLKTMRYLGRNWKQAAVGDAQGQLDLLFGRTGDDYLPACAMLRDSNKGVLLLLFEERTLYMPSNARVGTPLFQDRYLADDLSADQLYEMFLEAGVRTVYLRKPVYNPDLLEDMLALYPPTLRAMEELLLRKKLVFLGRVGNEEAFIFSVNPGHGQGFRRMY